MAFAALIAAFLGASKAPTPRPRPFDPI